jgi:hypothetical protein
VIEQPVGHAFGILPNQIAVALKKQRSEQSFPCQLVMKPKEFES